MRQIRQDAALAFPRLTALGEEWSPCEITLHVAANNKGEIPRQLIGALRRLSSVSVQFYASSKAS